MEKAMLFKGSVLLALYTVLGVPYGFTFKGLPVLLKHQGYSESEISFQQLTKNVWFLKGLWAPLIDRFFLPSLGKHRSWLLLSQVAMALVCLCAVFSDLGWRSWGWQPLLFAMNVIAATQDSIVDSLNVTFGGFAAVEVIGYNIGMMVGGGMLPSCSYGLDSLCAGGHLPPQGIFLLVAGLSFPAFLWVLLRGAVVDRDAPVAAELQFDGMYARFKELLRQRGEWLVIAYVFFYQFVDAGVEAMWGPFLVREGLPYKRVADIYSRSQLLTVLMLSLVGFASAPQRRGIQLSCTIAQGASHAVRLLFALRLLPVGDTWAFFGFYFASKCVGTLNVLLVKHTVLERIDPKLAATHYAGCYSGVEVLGKSLGPVAAGPFVELFGHHSLFALGIVNAGIVLWLLQRIHRAGRHAGKKSHPP